MKNIIFIKFMMIVCATNFFVHVGGMDRSPELKEMYEKATTEVQKRRAEERLKEKEADEQRKTYISGYRLNLKGKIAIAIAAGLVFAGGVASLYGLYQKFMGRESILPTFSIPSWMSGAGDRITNYLGIGSFSR